MRREEERTIFVLRIIRMNTTPPTLFIEQVFIRSICCIRFQILYSSILNGVYSSNHNNYLCRAQVHIMEFDNFCWGFCGWNKSYWTPISKSLCQRFQSSFNECILVEDNRYQRPRIGLENVEKLPKTRRINDIEKTFMDIKTWEIGSQQGLLNREDLHRYYSTRLYIRRQYTPKKYFTYQISTIDTFLLEHPFINNVGCIWNIVSTMGAHWLGARPSQADPPWVFFAKVEFTLDIIDFENWWPGGIGRWQFQNLKKFTLKERSRPAHPANS